VFFHRNNRPFAASCAPPARGCDDALAFGALQMIRTWRFAFIAATAVASAAAQGQEPAAAAQPDLAKAQQIVTQICAACHGADGNSTASVNPNLAGQGADYITLQLAHFKAGVRVNATMQAMSGNMIMSRARRSCSATISCIPRSPARPTTMSSCSASPSGPTG